MLYEYSGIKVKKYKGSVVYIIKGLTAKSVIKIKTSPFSWYSDIILSDMDEIIGINTNEDVDIYSPRKLLLAVKELLNSLTNLEELKVNDKELIEWWNNEIKLMKSAQNTLHDDIELKKDELKNHFVETIEQDGDTTWYTYYLNSSIGGFQVKFKDTLVDYSSMSICKMMLVEDTHQEYSRRIYFYDNHYSWVEDIDISTNLSWNDIRFVVDSDDLKNMETVDKEKQAYVELWEELDPYSSLEENRKSIRKWIADNKWIVENGELALEESNDIT